MTFKVLLFLLWACDRASCPYSVICLWFSEPGWVCLCWNRRGNVRPPLSCVYMHLCACVHVVACSCFLLEFLSWVEITGINSEARTGREEDLQSIVAVKWKTFIVYRCKTAFFQMLKQTDATHAEKRESSHNFTHLFLLLLDWLVLVLISDLLVLTGVLLVLQYYFLIISKIKLILIMISIYLLFYIYLVLFLSKWNFVYTSIRSIWGRWSIGSKSSSGLCQFVRQTPLPCFFFFFPSCCVCSLGARRSLWQTLSEATRSAINTWIIAEALLLLHSVCIYILNLDEWQIRTLLLTVSQCPHFWI